MLSDFLFFSFQYLLPYSIAVFAMARLSLEWQKNGLGKLTAVLCGLQAVWDCLVLMAAILSASEIFVSGLVILFIFGPLILSILFLIFAAISLNQLRKQNI